VVSIFKCKRIEVSKIGKGIHFPEKAGRVFNKLFGFFFSPKRLKVWLHFWGSFLVMVVIVLDYLSRGIES